MAKSADPDQTLVWVYTVCTDLSEFLGMVW